MKNLCLVAALGALSACVGLPNTLEISDRANSEVKAMSCQQLSATMQQAVEDNAKATSNSSMLTAMIVPFTASGLVEDQSEALAYHQAAKLEHSQRC